MPHPRFYRLLYAGSVQLTGRPEAVDGGETILEVRATRLDEAKKLLSESGRPDIAELYQYVSNSHQAVSGS